MTLINGQSIGDKAAAGTEAPVAIPNSLTVFTAVDSWLHGMVINNTTASAITLTLKNGANTELMSSLSIPANSYTALEHLINKPKFVGGFKWQASATGLNCQLSLTVEG